MGEKLKIIFVGIPDMALVCLSNLFEKKFNIVGVVPPSKNHETYKYFKNFVQEKGLNFIEFENSINGADCIEKVKNLNADIGVVCSYNTLIKKDFLNSTRLGFINCHPSLLPYYRGAAPYFHMINNGEKQGGVTLHFMDETFDTGPVVFQQKFDIAPFETMGTIFNRTTYMISDALIDTLSKIEQGIEIQKIPQEKNENFIKAPRVGGNFRIRWNKNCFEIERLIRACNPFYNAFSNFRGVSLKAIKAHAIETKTDSKQEIIFGQILKADENYLIIAAKNGLISLDVFQVGTWGIFTPLDFYYTFSPKIGEILT